MPSIKLELGKYVTLRPRKDGTARVYFQVPSKLRPNGWLSAIPLPIAGERRGDLSDADEVSRIQADAAHLYSQLVGDRHQRPASIADAKTIPTLNRMWQQTQAFKNKKPRTQRNYATAAVIIEAWSASVGHQPVAKMRADKVEAFLAIYDDRPTTKKQLAVVLKLMLAYAIKLEWTTQNPAAGISVKVPHSCVEIWEEADMQLYAQACLDANRPSLATMIWTQWEIGQRLTDACLLRWGHEYIAERGVFSFTQSKTSKPVAIPISQHLRDLLDKYRTQGSLYLFVNESTGQPWREKELSQAFAYIRRTRVVAKGGPYLLLRVLRHSCVVAMARASCVLPEIASITGHTLASVPTVLSHYLPRDSQVALNAQIKRGLIAAKPAD